MPNGQSKFSLQNEVKHQAKEIGRLEREIKGLKGKIDRTLFKNDVPFSAPIGDELITFPKGSKFIVVKPFGWEVNAVITLKPIMDIEPDNPTYIRLSDKSWDECFCQVEWMSDVNKGETNDRLKSVAETNPC